STQTFTPSTFTEYVSFILLRPYARSAASVRRCDCCDGSGITEVEVFTNKIHYPDGKPPKWAKVTKGVYPSYWEEWKSVRE
ncbi:hypothetical protein Q2458_25430, partial [Escherichia coli]|nr:hypothetical protein [Escherichia coli]